MGSTVVEPLITIFPAHTMLEVRPRTRTKATIAMLLNFIIFLLFV
jgi:hypothetical protein